MPRALGAILVLGVSLGGCGSSEASLTIDLRTDYEPGVEFTSVETTLEVAGTSRDAIPAGASASDDFITGRRVAFFDAVPHGVVDVRVALRDPGGTLLATRRTQLTVSGDTGLIVEIDRACAGVACPGATDSPSATECDDGRCVPPTCQPAMPGTCVPPLDGGPAAADAGRMDGGPPPRDGGPPPRDGGREIDGGTPVPDGGPPPVDAGGPDPSLVAWYRCEGLVPAALVADSSGNGHDGVCADSACPDPVSSGRVGSACSFRNDSVVVSSLRSFTPTAFTIALWARPQPGSEASMIAKPLAAQYNDSFQLTLRDLVPGGPDPDRLSFIWASSTTAVEAVDHTITGAFTDWVYIAATWDGTEKLVYVDGDVGARDIDGRPIVYDSHEVLIGFDENVGAPASYYDGLLDEIRIYDRALSEREIEALMAL